ncbi:STAS domain-containing protein [Shewanella yunxiaonensis]|uniref:STAS domain-containing protein n=1 Tax=Shewanella yunxiaonensis TaxID=2829809 RepID=A0ABX7YUJ3_9GAMM|nr:STAS domain-containing protein [Shewanella yunxiaonensis]QUN06337.1 STAS domain-containing protein [Shewanella yunxiaonensis]
MIEFKQQGDCCQVLGRLSQEDVKQLWSQRKTLVATGTRTLELSGLEYSDTAGVAFLMELLSQHPSELQLVAPSTQVKRLIDLYDLQDFFNE